MSKADRWLRLPGAAQLVKRTLGVSLGAAQPILCMAGADQTVRTRGAETVQWWTRIDLEEGILLGISETGLGDEYADVVFNKADLLDWLTRNREWLRSEYATPPKAARRLKPGTRPSREKPFWPKAREAAFQWFDDRGYPNPGDGEQAKLEGHINSWMSERGHSATESTIRRHVKGWIAEYKASVEEADKANLTR